MNLSTTEEISLDQFLLFKNSRVWLIFNQETNTNGLIGALSVCRLFMLRDCLVSSQIILRGRLLEPLFPIMRVRALIWSEKPYGFACASNSSCVHNGMGYMGDRGISHEGRSMHYRHPYDIEVPGRSVAGRWEIVEILRGIDESGRLWVLHVLTAFPRAVSRAGCERCS